MKRVLILSAITLLGISYSAHAQPIIFDDGEVAKIDSEISSSINQAMEDSDAVVGGNPPIHARVDANAPLPSDGGTTYYLGQGYKLTILKSLASLAGVQGYFYGPIIVFDENVVVGNTNEISHIKFYSMEAFRTLNE